MKSVTVYHVDEDIQRIVEKLVQDLDELLKDPSYSVEVNQLTNAKEKYEIIVENNVLTLNIASDEKIYLSGATAFLDKKKLIELSIGEDKHHQLVGQFEDFLPLSQWVGDRLAEERRKAEAKEKARRQAANKAYYDR